MRLCLARLRRQEATKTHGFSGSRTLRISLRGYACGFGLARKCESGAVIVVRFRSRGGWNKQVSDTLSFVNSEPFPHLMRRVRSRGPKAAGEVQEGVRGTDSAFRVAASGLIWSAEFRMVQGLGFRV